MTFVLKHHQARDLAATKRSMNDKHFVNSWFKTGPLYTKQFEISQSCEYFSMALSNDETFFITGGDYANKVNVLKLSMGDVFGTGTKLEPTVIFNARHNNESEDGEDATMCVAISPDDRRIFSSGTTNRIFIHDIQRPSQMLHCIPQSGEVWGISVQRDSHEGYVFAAGSTNDGVLRIFDIRYSTIFPVIEAGKGNGIFSVAFSPLNTTHVAVAGRDGCKVIDIRHPKKDLLLLSTDKYSTGVRYNSKGNRLVFLETGGPHVIELAAFVSGGMKDGKKNLISTDQNDNHWTEHDYNCCFAGANDELIVAASHHRGLLVWHVSDIGFNSSPVNQLKRLQYIQEVTSVCYSQQRGVLIACGISDDIRVWTPFNLLP